jgi:hypothetical protein
VCSGAEDQNTQEVAVSKKKKKKKTVQIFKIYTKIHLFIIQAVLFPVEHLVIARQGSIKQDNNVRVT